MEVAEKQTVFIEVKHPVLEDDILSLLCSAFEGGIGYWACVYGYKYPIGTHSHDFNLNGRHNNSGNYYHPTQILSLFPGAGVYLGSIDTGKTIENQWEVENVRNQFSGIFDHIHCLTLNREKVLEGLQLMATSYPRHWADFVSGNSDATTGDVLVQLALFGEIIFG